MGIGHAIDMVADTLRRYGLEVKFKPGKSEVVLQLFGPSSRSLLRDMGPAGKRAFTSPRGNAICAVEQYKHLGSISHATGSTIPDAKAKAHKCDNTYGSLATGVFGNTRIHPCTRLSLAASLCFSRLAFGCDTWVRRQPAAEATINHARMRVLRRIAGCPRYQGGGPTDMDVVGSLDTVPTAL